jgi:hypothetical protein
MGINAGSYADPGPRPAADATDATLQVNFADMISQALQMTETDAIEKARELLRSNQLLSPEYIRSAAESIASFGI